MLCPKCETETRVIDTRKMDSGAIRRRRQCPNPQCNHRFATKEEITRFSKGRPPDIDTLRELLRRHDSDIKSMKRQISRLEMKLEMRTHNGA